VVTVPLQVVPPLPGRQRECSRGSKAVDAAHCGVDVPAVTAAETVEVVMVELLLHTMTAEIT